jgi:uroporphyrinogen-III synthase
MTKTIVITRARGDEASLVDALHARGYRTIHEPLTEIFLNHTARPELEYELQKDPSAVIITSRNGVRALAALTEMRDPMILCVGESTADVATSAGFTRVYAAGGDIEQLLNYIGDAYEEDAHFLYVSAEHIRTDLEPLLAIKGMQVKRIVTYTALPSQALSETLVEQLKRGQLDAITFLSQRSAQIFSTLMAKAEINTTAKDLQAIALSEAVAEPIRQLPWQAVAVSRQPTLASLLECVDNALP